MTTMAGKQGFGRLASAWVWFVMFMILFIDDVIHAFAFEEVRPALFLSPSPALCALTLALPC